jgi:hypothetical protein
MHAWLQPYSAEVVMSWVVKQPSFARRQLAGYAEIWLSWQVLTDGIGLIDPAQVWCPSINRHLATRADLRRGGQLPECDSMGGSSLELVTSNSSHERAVSEMLTI